MGVRVSQTAHVTGRAPYLFPQTALFTRTQGGAPCPGPHSETC